MMSGFWVLYMFSLVIMYFLILGILVLFESKVLGVTGNSLGPSKVCFKALYLFILDMLKLVSKSKISGSQVLQVSYVLFLLGVIQMVMMLSFMFMPFGVGSFIDYGVLWFLVLGVSLVILKLMVIGSFGSDFLSSLGSSLVEVFINIEILFTSVYLMYVLIFSSMGMWFWVDVFGVFKPMSLFGFLPFTFLLYLFLLIKLSSTPFDYMESESEFVGGGSTEIYGIFFVVWSSMEYSLMMNGSLVLYIFGVGIFFQSGDYLIMGSLLFNLGVLISSAVFVSFYCKSFQSLMVKAWGVLVVLMLSFVFIFSFYGGCGEELGVLLENSLLSPEFLEEKGEDFLEESGEEFLNEVFINLMCDMLIIMS